MKWALNRIQIAIHISNSINLINHIERGMCLLGEQCPYDHGIDPLVITGPIPPYPPPPFPMSIPPPPNLPKTTSGLLLPPLIPPRNTANTGIYIYLSIYPFIPLSICIHSFLFSFIHSFIHSFIKRC